MNKKEDWFLFIFCVALATLIGYWSGFTQGVDLERRRAFVSGFGKWIINEEGDREFKYGK